MEPLPAGASASVAAVLTGPPRRVVVVAPTQDAVYLSTGDPDVPALCLASRAAARVPCAVILGGAVHVARGALAGLQAGAVGTAGAGAVTVHRSSHGRGTLAVRVARWWRPPRPVPSGDGLRRRDGPLPDVDALLGRGAGLTPYGDDVLAGALVALAALGSPAALVLAGQILPAAFTRTTFVSAALLAHAARGECIPELADYLRALALADAARLVGAAAALRTVGHTSGDGLMDGVAKVLDVPAGTGRRAENRPGRGAP